jgi:PAS domain S-box-containing protein
MNDATGAGSDPASSKSFQSAIHLQDLADFMKALDDNALVAITNLDGRITHVNDKFCAVSKYPREELLGQDHRILRSGYHDESFFRTLWATILAKSAWTGEIKNRAKDGTFYWVDATIVPALDAGGAIKHFLAFYSDITQRKEAEDALRQAQRLESLRVMAGGIAHDFNNLLTSILGNADLGARTLPADSPTLPFLERIEQASLKAADLTNQLLAFTGQHPWQPIRLDLALLVKGMAPSMALSAPKNVELRIDLAPEALHINVDPTQLHQVGMVSIRLGECWVESGTHPRQMLLPPGKPGRYAFLEIADTGCGMAPETVSRIFEPFFTTKFAGRGLGLSAVMGILHASDGAVSVESTPGQGSTFQVFFPLVEALETLGTSEAASIPAIPRGTVLFVDDEAMLRELAEEILTEAGFHVLQAKDGLEALECFRAEQACIALVIMDLTMPRLGGLEAFRKIREWAPSAKVILSSGYTELGLAESLKDVKPDGFLQKPYKLNELRDIAQRVLQG